MQAFLANRRALRVTAALLLVLGLGGDCFIGALLLTRMQFSLFLLHFPMALSWAVGVNFVTWHGSQPEPNLRAYLNKWGVAAFLLSMATFPGLWPLAYSCALGIARFLYLRKRAGRVDVADLQPEDALPVVEISPSQDWLVQPFIDTCQNADTQARLTTVTRLSQYANPGTTKLLRQFLSDPRPEIRSNASIALSRLEDDLSHHLNTSFEQWAINPADKNSVFALADQYYQYATSNVLDTVSQRFYLTMARDLLLQLSKQEPGEDARLWLKLARIRQSLGEIVEALADARHALQLQPDWPEASFLAMELAFSLHSWDTFVALAGREAGAASQTAGTSASSLKALQWWTTLHPEVREDVTHD
ncbi:MAG TPA: hypothetical protein VKR06_20700 [Ktedonosporobacter sp.]|nr:hypothetical protein [Ktedonosporobacter sp.]